MPTRKASRARSNQKAAKKRLAIVREKAADVYDFDIRKHNVARSNFFASLLDACHNPQDYLHNCSYDRSHIKIVAQYVHDKRLAKPEREDLFNLLTACRRTKLLEEKQTENFIGGLLDLLKWSAFWIRDPLQWEPSTKNVYRQFASLARHLLCKYDVPSFMNKIWYCKNSRNETYQEWFINLGSGENIRKQSRLPIPMTKKMAHYFLQAPESLQINEAIRWGQVMAEGGNERVARAILSTPLRHNFDNDEFWISVIRFFIANPMLDHYQYGPIYDYIYNQKYRDRGAVYINNELVRLGVPQPNFSMHRRDPNTLLRQVEEWHRRINRERTHRGYGRLDCQWNSCGIPGMIKKGKDELIEIAEITTSKELYAEGDKMRHCVGSYVESCRTYRFAVYSLRRTDSMGVYREATISVRLGERLISEARKSCNRPLTAKDWNYVQEWANQTKLQISSWVR